MEMDNGRLEPPDSDSHLDCYFVSVFWALLGYEIGKGFGHNGRVLLNKTFLLSLIPNLILMVLTVFQIIPHSWFAPLLTKTFIIACIIFTIILYPISWIGYRWGEKLRYKHFFEYIPSKTIYIENLYKKRDEYGNENRNKNW